MYFERQNTRYYFGAFLALVALVLLFAVVRCGTDEAEVTAPAAADAADAPTSDAAPQRWSVTAWRVATPAPTTTTTAPPIVPGSANDPWGPILCASVGHPAHHSPCVKAKVAKAQRPQSATTRGAGGSSGGGWEALRQCESSGNYSARSGPYSGAYQFDAQTHRSVGGDGYAGDDSPAEQDAAARRLYAARGAQPWPTCGRHLG